MEPTSEQELRQLFDEGNITEEEYQELLEAIRQKETVQKPVEVPQQLNGGKTRTGYGKAALLLMIAGLVLPIAALPLFFVIGIFILLPCLGIGFLCELLAFIFGIIGWKSKSGKIVAIGVPCMGLLIIPGLLLLFLFGVRVQHQAGVKEAIAHEHAAITELRAYNLENHKTFPMNTLEGLISQDMAEIDEDIFVNGGGSLRIVSDSPEKRTIRLYEIPSWDIKGEMTYQAKLKSINLQGKAYLEMQCEIPGKNVLYSRSLEQAITGTTDWTTTATSFYLETKLKPANMKLNLVVEGPGTIWIDDITLSSNSL